LNDDLFKIVLLKLSIDTLYRLYLKSSKIRKFLEDRSFWKKLIECDYGVVPRFKIDLKLHFLRIDGLKLAGSVWFHGNRNHFKIGKGEDGFGRIELTNVTYIINRGEIMITRDGRCHIGNVIHESRRDRFEEKIIDPPRGERFKQVFVDHTLTSRLITCSGKMINFDGTEYRFPNSAITEINSIGHSGGLLKYLSILTKHGDVYFRYPTKKELKIKLPEKIIQQQFDGQTLLGESGNTYSITSWDDGSYYQVRSGVHYISEIGSLGYIMNNEQVENLKYLPKRSLPVLGFYGWGVIDSKLHVVASKSQRLGNEHLNKLKVLQQFDNVLQVDNRLGATHVRVLN